MIMTLGMLFLENICEKTMSLILIKDSVRCKSDTG